MASITLTAAILIIVAAYVVGAAESQPTIGGVVAAASLLAISFTGLLYAWRLGTGSAD